MSVLLVVAGVACGGTAARAATLPQRPSTPLEREAAAAFAAAERYHASGQLQVEQRVLEALLRRLDPVADQRLTAEAERRLAVAREQQARPRPSGFLHDVGSAFSAAASALVAGLLLLAVALLLVWLLWLAQRACAARKRPRDELAVMLEDLTVAAADRRDGNRRLGGEFEAAMRSRLDGAASSDEIALELDMTGDLDGSAALDVRVPGEELVLLEPYVGGVTTVTFGPLTIDPRTLFSLLRGAAAPRSTHELHGTLTGDTTLTLTARLLTDGRGRRSWSTSGRDRETLAATVAERVGFELAGRPVSTSWESIEAYRAAERILRRRSDGAEARRKTLVEAKRELERALAHDPVNPLARYELGTVLRKLGMNEEAVAQFAAIERFATDETPAQLRAAARYSEAVALSKLTTWPEHRRALELLEGLLKDATTPRRSAVVRSTWAAAKVFELSELRDAGRGRPAEERQRRHGERLLGEIVAVRDDLEAIRTVDPADAVAVTQALAVAENAYGRALHLLGRHSEAIEAFMRALSLAPQFTDADVNIASALLKLRKPSPGWDERVLRHLSRALEESPNDRKALYLRGKLCLRLGQEDEARRWLERGWALGDRAVLPLLAERRWADGLDRRADAIALLEYALRTGPGADHLQRQMVGWVATLARAGRATARQLAAGHRAGEAVVRAAARVDRPVTPRLRDAIALIEAQRDRNGDADPELAIDGAEAAG